MLATYLWSKHSYRGSIFFALFLKRLHNYENIFSLKMMETVTILSKLSAVQVKISLLRHLTVNADL